MKTLGNNKSGDFLYSSFCHEKTKANNKLILPTNIVHVSKASMP